MAKCLWLAILSLMDSESLDIFMKVLMAVALGGLIGVERELAHRPAGIRTHMFVTGAATLVLSISKVVIDHFAETTANVSADPVRVVEAVIVGISFIGAGTVLKSTKTHHVYFLTTAASILFAAAIGITVAVDLLGLAVALTALVVFINYVVGNIELHYMKKRKHFTDEE